MDIHSPRETHLVKEALAIAALVIERQTGPLKASSDLLDMKLLLDRVTSEAELEHYMKMARIAVNDEQPPT